MSPLRPILRPLFESLPKELASHTLDLDFTASESIDPRITFTRASTAMRTNADGVLESVAINTPRINYDPVTLQCRGLRVEGARTNLALWSNDFTNSVWVKTRATIASGAALGPDGAMSMSKLVEDTSANNSHVLTQSVSVVSGSKYTSSIYAKAAERSWLLMLAPSAAFGANYSAYFDLGTGTLGAVSTGAVANIVHVGGGIYRCSLTPPAAAASVSASLTVAQLATENLSPTYTGDGVSGIYIGRAQVEVGGQASSQIDTGSAAATRSSELASMTGTDFSDWYNPIEGTFIAVFSAPTAVASADCTAFAANDGTQNEQIDFRAYSSACGGRVRKGGANVVATAQAPTSVDDLVLCSAFAYAENDSVTALQGALSAVDTSCPMPVGLTRLEIGSRVGGGFLNGHIRRLLYYPRRLPNSTLQMLTRAP